MLECAMYDEIKEKGIENINTEELFKAADIYKDLVNSWYWFKLVDAMTENPEEVKRMMMG